MGVVLAQCAVHGQTSDFEIFNPLSSKSAGVHLLGASVSTSYFSSAYGVGITGLLPASDSNVVMAQGALLVGWSRHRENSHINITYSPSYIRGLTTSKFSSFNQSLSLSAGKKLNAKWSVDASVETFLTDFSQLLFASSRYGSISTVPSTFDDLASAILTGKSENPALDQLVSAASPVRSPEAAVLYGNRLLSSAGSISASYAHSSRSVYSASLVASRTQYYAGESTAPQGAPTYQIPMTTSVGAQLGWSYSITPRMSLTVDGSSIRTVSKYQDAYASHAAVSIGRTMSRRWFVRGAGGIGVISPVRQAVSTSQGVQKEWGGSIGYKLEAHTLLAQYERTASDLYGFGASETEASMGVWTWKRPGRTISLSSGFGYIRMISPVLTEQATWTAHASAAKALDAHLAMSIAYSYIQYPPTVLAYAPTIEQHGVIVTLSWSPSERQ